ncbi:DUF3626 domain-containing protein [Streptomyces sp. TLI_105]|uniref:DUF3626 domain-containing protein n=1 Tax=Streptomyces sp. TLI_105 TaxID=1881019 RepID=UPI000B1AD0F9
MTLNFHPDRPLHGRLILDAMAEDGVYRSQFVTRTSKGGPTAHPGGDRWRWESRIFGGAYDEAAAHERPVYGALNFRRKPVGGAPRFGSAHGRPRATSSPRPPDPARHRGRPARRGPGGPAPAVRRRRQAPSPAGPADQAGHRLRRGRAGGRPPAFDAETYKQRNTVERCINRLKRWRGLAMRTDKLAIVYNAALHLAAILIWARTPRTSETGPERIHGACIRVVRRSRSCGWSAGWSRMKTGSSGPGLRSKL